jgi:predicted amino acid dehydrogenase
MDSFGFIIHPLNVKTDVQRKFPLLGRILSERQIEFFSQYFPPVYLSEIEGITSAATGKQIKGWLIACPLTARQMLALPEKQVYHKILQTGRMAERLGAGILGLGAFTSVAGDAGVTIAERLAIPVTTGDAYTVAVAVEAIQQAAEGLDISLPDATVAVVGATGAIGKAAADLLADQAGRVALIGRRLDALEEVRSRLAGRGRAEVIASTDLSPLADARIVLTVTSAIHSVIQTGNLRPGSIVCDVALPRDIPELGASARQEYLVIDGGMVDVPGAVDFHFNFGLPPGKAYACMAETMALALEGHFEDYTLGRDIPRARVEEISAIARKHGFRLGGFRSFGRVVTQDQVEAVRRRAKSRRA